MAATAQTKKTRQDFAGAVKEAVKEPSAAVNTPVHTDKKAGRPSTGRTYKITLAIPEELINDIDAAALLHKGNRTAYINSLIKKDLDENLKKYEEFNKMLNK